MTHGEASERGFQILYEDDSLLGVVKPSGVATQAPPGIDSLERRIKEYLEAKSAVGGDAELYLGIPHRLDRPASGAMIFAKTRRAARNLAKQFERRQVTKVYWAAVEGFVHPAEGAWSDFLWKVYGQPRAQVVDASHPGAQEAILHYRVIGTHNYGSWLQIKLETGRTHQVRVQAATRGHAIIGDEFYGGRIPFGEPTEDQRLRPIALHARSLSIRHPLSRETLLQEADVPAAWNALGLAHSE